jgi:hypothetical protein
MKKFKLELGEFFLFILFWNTLIYYFSIRELDGVSYLEKPNLSSPGAFLQNIVSLGLGFNVNSLFSILE